MTSNTNYARELANIGTIRVNDKRFKAAEACLRRAHAIDTQPTYKVNLASTLLRVGKAEEAEFLASEVAEKHTQVAAAWSVLGLAQLALGKYQPSRDSFGMASYLDPSSAEFHLDYSASLMLLGDWEKGWREYEHRLPMIGYKPVLPPWDGAVDQHVLVTSEQGAGDVIQFSRYIPLLAERVNKVTFSVPPSMYSLFQPMREFCDVVTPGMIPAGPEQEILLQTLPCYFDTQPADMPEVKPEWFATAPLPDPGPADQFKVGICWAGSSGHQRDMFRSIPFEAFLPLAFNPRNHLYSFQVGPRAADIAIAGAQSIVSDLSGMIESKWSAAASFVQKMDVLVTCDTGIAHLAASLGKPVILLIAAIPDWRWLVSSGSVTPWYPSMRIIRQKKLFDWATPIQEACDLLEQMAQEV